MKHKVRHLHFVGIGGSGMSGIAELLANQGYQISGSDQSNGATIERLKGLGLVIYSDHAPQHIQGADAIVVSTAIQADNPEVLAAKANKIPVVPRAHMLAELMRLKQGIAIAGTHGKTTTTSLIANCFAEGGLDPTFVIGGRLNAANTNAKLGTGDFLIAEADESDASFLSLSPVIAVVTNIDADHMSTYNHDWELLRQAFVDFLHRLPFYGVAVVCGDDEQIRNILPRISKQIITYGCGNNAQIRAEEIHYDGLRTHFHCVREGDTTALTVTLNLPGHHNVLNALAAIAVATEVGIADDAIVRALAQYAGVSRRFQSYGALPCSRGGNFDVIDDYGHHPTEIAATLAAARGAFPKRRIVLVFQPHRYSRTLDSFADFVTVLAQCDVLLLLEVYSAGEAPIAGADGRALARALRAGGKIEPIFVDTISHVPAAIDAVTQDDDVVLLLGAGSIGSVASVLRLGAESKFADHLANTQ